MKDVQEIFHEKMYKYIDQYLIYEQNMDLRFLEKKKVKFINRKKSFFFLFYFLTNLNHVVVFVIVFFD